MIKVGVVPLDSRPCNTSWLFQLGTSVNYQMVMYPTSKCGNLHQGANIYNIIEWINSQAQKLDYLILSGDGFAFGGLIQARKAEIDLEEVLPLLESLKKTKKENPQLKIYLFDTIMRTSISATSIETGKYWSLMNRYSKALGRYYFLKEQKDLEEINQLESVIPQHIIDTYLDARRKKLEVTKCYLKLMAKGVIDEMIVLQEDSMPYGIQKKDQAELEKFVKTVGIQKEVNFYNGTDEGGVVLLAKIMLENSEVGKNIYLHSPQKEIFDKCCLFEDRPLKENIKKMCQTIGLHLVDDIKKADAVLSIFATTENIDLDLIKYQEIKIDKNQVYQNYIKELNHLTEHYPVALVDLYFPNGGSLELLNDVNYRKCINYSAWNTASNSLGSSLCAICAFFVNGMNETLEDFKKARVMDDCIYQYIARRKVNEKLWQQKINIYDLENVQIDVLKEIEQIMHQYDSLIDYQTYQLSLPWNRTFEIEINMRKDNEMKYDCIVGGAGPSGIASSIALARRGCKVLLIEKNALIGGTNVLSLVTPFMTYHNQDDQIIGGIAEEVISRLKEKKGTLGHLRDPLGFCSTVTPVDVESLKEVYLEMLQEAKVDVLLHTLITDVQTIKTENGYQIKEIEVRTPEKFTFQADYFIDATGDGYICHFAKADSFIGRDTDHLCQPMTLPFVVGGVDVNQLFDEMKKDPQNFVLRKDYDYQYLGISGFFKEVKKAKEAGDFTIERDRVLLFANVRQNEVTVNMTRVTKKSALNVFELTEAEIEGRNQIKEVFRFLQKYIPGFEKSYIATTPYQIGVRESRHVVCDYIMTKEDILENKSFSDAIVKGAFPMDIHSPNGSKLELIQQTNLLYEIPFRSILVKNFTNLLVTGRCIGATHEAAASLRVTPVVMALGEAAGIAVSEAIKKNIEVRKINHDVFLDLLLNKETNK